MSPVITNSVLVLIALIWGATFLPIKLDLETMAPVTIVAFRFLVATLVLVVIFYRRLKGLDRRHWIAGSWIGLSLGLGYLFQTVGLLYTTTGKAAFLTGLYVVLAPIFSIFFLKRGLNRYASLGIALSAIGLALVSLRGDLTIGPGDLWVLACAVAFGLQIALTSFYMEKRHALDPILISLIQIGVSTIMAFGAMLALNQKILLPTSWTAIVFLGVVATSLVFCAQTWVQRYASTTQVALVLALEPVFAGLIGWKFAGEILTVKEMAGCGLILLGAVVCQRSDR